MTRMTGPDCAVICNIINTHTHTHIHIHNDCVPRCHRVLHDVTVTVTVSMIGCIDRQATRDPISRLGINRERSAILPMVKPYPLGFV